MSWWVLLALAVWAYGCKLVGLEVLSRVELRAPFDAVASLLPAALFASIVVQQTFSDGDASMVLTRMAGVAVGGVAIIRRAPLVVVIVAAAATTALLRAVT